MSTLKGIKNSLDKNIKLYRIRTAGDNRVCDTCGGLTSIIWTQYNRPALPIHPNCRCEYDVVTTKSIIESSSFIVSDEESFLNHILYKTKSGRNVTIGTDKRIKRYESVSDDSVMNDSYDPSEDKYLSIDFRKKDAESPSGYGTRLRTIRSLKRSYQRYTHMLEEIEEYKKPKRGVRKSLNTRPIINAITRKPILGTSSKIEKYLNTDEGINKVRVIKNFISEYDNILSKINNVRR
jgi:hypothetical protein